VKSRTHRWRTRSGSSFVRSRSIARSCRARVKAGLVEGWIEDEFGEELHSSDHVASRRSQADTREQLVDHHLLLHADRGSRPGDRGRRSFARGVLDHDRRQGRQPGTVPGPGRSPSRDQHPDFHDRNVAARWRKVSAEVWSVPSIRCRSRMTGRGSTVLFGSSSVSRPRSASRRTNAVVYSFVTPARNTGVWGVTGAPPGRRRPDHAIDRIRCGGRGSAPRDPQRRPPGQRDPQTRAGPITVPHRSPYHRCPGRTARRRCSRSRSGCHRRRAYRRSNPG
jgi:hypothetical protein